MNDETQTRLLLEGSPFSTWPTGMPASVDPELVLIGVSPGNSPMPAARAVDLRQEDGPRFVSAPSLIKPKNSHFYYPDSAGYWSKLRYLVHEYFRMSDSEVTEHEALAGCSHFNLGTGDSGVANPAVVEKDVTRWVSRLLDSIHKPRLVILFGLKELLKNEEISNSWNHAEGLNVNWKRADNTFPFVGYAPKTYRFREWSVTASNQNAVRLVIWPNHPSRVPFSDMNIWRASVSQYLEHFRSKSR